MKLKHALQRSGSPFQQHTVHLTFRKQAHSQTNDVMRDLRLNYASFEINLIPKALAFLV